MQWACGLGAVARKSSAVILLAGLAGCGAGDRAPSEPDGARALELDAGWAALMDWEALPVLGGSRTAQTSSRDRDGAVDPPGIDAGNKDFNTFTAICGDRPAVLFGTSDGVDCDPGIEGYVIASADDGPGFVSRLFMGAGSLHDTLDLNELTTGFTDETIRIYVDDLKEPVFEGPVTDLEEGRSPPFVPPLTRAQSGSLVSYVPISYGSKIRIVLDDLRTESTTYFYEVDRRRVYATVAFNPKVLAKALPDFTRLQARVKEARGTTSWADDDVPVEPGDLVAVLDRDGGGTIERLELAVDAAALSELSLVATWDDAPTPAIDVPLADLFVQSGGAASFETLPMTVRIDGSRAVLTLALPMPFESRATISVKNSGQIGRAVHARLDGVDEVPEGSWGYLHALRNERRAPAEGERYSVLDATGPGKYVGTAMRLVGHSNPGTLTKHPFNFLEGDDWAVADDDLVRQGTGTEESFDGGWYFRSGPFSAPFSAVVAVGPAGDSGGQVAAVRWQVLSAAIDFRRMFDLSYEYGAGAPSTADEYSSVAFFYSM